MSVIHDSPLTATQSTYPREVVRSQLWHKKFLFWQSPTAGLSLYVRGYTTGGYVQTGFNGNYYWCVRVHLPNEEVEFSITASNFVTSLYGGSVPFETASLSEFFMGQKGTKEKAIAEALECISHNAGVTIRYLTELMGLERAMSALSGL